MGDRGQILSLLQPSPVPVADDQQLMRRILLETSEVERLTQENRDLLASIELGRADVQAIRRKNKALNQQLELLSSVHEDSLAQLCLDTCRGEMRMLA